MAKVFSVGDTVFAKVRGYPAWPARVDKIVNGRTNKCKYHVFFYGTSETAVCKGENVYKFEENKGKFGKPLKRKGFNEALSQVEILFRGQAVTNRRTETRNDHEDSDAEGKLVIDENPNNGAKQADGKKKGTKRNGYDKKSLNGGNSVSKHSPEPSPKRFKRSSIPHKYPNIATQSSFSDNKFINGSSPLKPEIVSRSGRKIKPKKFADEDCDRSTSSTDGDTVLKSNSDSRKEPLRRQSGATTKVNAKKQVRLSVKTPAALNNSVSGHHSPSVPDTSKDRYGTLSNEEKRRRARLAWFRTEATMLEIENKLKNNLNLEKANTAESVKLLKHLSTLHIKPLMLKKHSYVVFTVRKLRRYVGNPGAWNLTEAQKHTFESEASQIRNLCDSLYNKFKALFTVPENSKFIDVFTENLKTFQRQTESLSAEKICALTEELSLASGDSHELESQPQIEANTVQNLDHTPEAQLSREMCTYPYVTIKIEPLDMDQLSYDGPCCSSPLCPARETTEIGKSELKIEDELAPSPVKLETDLTCPVKEEEK